MRIHDYLDYRARITPDAPAANDGQRSWTYGELSEKANRFAHATAALGLGPGDRFAVVAKNCLEWLAVYYGAFKAGTIPVPLNYRLNPREWCHIVNDSTTRAVIAQEDYSAAIDSVRDGFSGVEHLVTIGDPAASWTSFDELLAAQRSDPPEQTIAEDGDAYQMYTSGTTGLPKGAVLTHRAVAANVSQIGTALAGIAGERALVVMPLYHAGAAITTFAWIAAGVEIRVMADFDPHACVRALDEEELSWATFVPAMIQSMLTLVPDVRERRYPRLRGIAYGASPIAEATLRGALEAFRCGFYQAYGMTETTAVLTMLYPADHDRALAGRPDLLLSCGRPVVGTEVRVVDGSDKDAPARSVGEIVGRGPQLMRGYWAMPDATAESLRGGWMHTGDAGYLDEEGFVYVCDRVKDMIVSGGENVYPREIEDVLFGMDGIADVAVIGVPDEKWGEVGKAFVVTRPGAVLREQEVITWCRDRLAGYKTPRSVEFVEALPRNPSGKVLKTELRAQYWKDRGRNVS